MMIDCRSRKLVALQTSRSFARTKENGYGLRVAEKRRASGVVDYSRP